MQKYGNPEEVLREREMRKAVKYDECARAFYEEYQYLKNDEYTTLDEDLKAEYTHQCQRTWRAAANEGRTPCDDGEP